MTTEWLRENLIRWLNWWLTERHIARCMRTMDIYLSSIAVLSRFGLIEVATQYTWPSENAEGYYEWTCSSELKEQVYQPLVWIREFVHPKKGSADDMDHPITHKVLRMLTLKYDQNKREDWYSSLLIKLDFFAKDIITRMNKTVTWSSKGYWTLNIHWELDCDPQMKVIWYSYILQVDGKDNTTGKKKVGS